MTDSTDPRLEAASRAVELAVGANLDGWPAFPEKYFGNAARSIIDAIDAADEAAGVRRVSQQELQDNLELARQGERQRIAEALAATRSLGDRPALLQHVDRLINSTVGAADSPVGGVS